MNAILKWTMALTLLSATAYGQVPTSNNTSDENANTGMGTESMGGPAEFNQGFDNTAAGDAALRFNTTGDFNTATGAAALANNTTSNDNTATGYSALIYNKIAADNTAVGFEALYTNDKPATGVAIQNTAIGSLALYNNETGSSNTAAGYQALHSMTTGSNNIAVGHQAGLNVATGSNNIEIGNLGAAGDNKVIKIGTESTQNKTLIAGIYGRSVSGSPVYIASNGQLGTVVSSERFKTAITTMGSSSEKLDELRPVTFKLKSDETGTRQYGLIAEEVAKIYPELVIRDQNDRIDGVRYDELTPMLLNEVQKQRTQLQQLKEKLQVQEARLQGIEQVKQQVAELQTLVSNQRTAMR